MEFLGEFSELLLNPAPLVHVLIRVVEILDIQPLRPTRLRLGLGLGLTRGPYVGFSFRQSPSLAGW